MEKTLELRQQEIIELRKQLAEKESEGRKIADIPAHEIMQKFGVTMKEAKPAVFVFVDRKEGKHLIAADNRLRNADGKILTRNAMETVALVRRARDLAVPDKHQENLECGKTLARFFGEERGQAAVLYAYREIHHEDIKEYKAELEKAAPEKNRQQKTVETDSRLHKESSDKTPDKNKERGWTHSR